MYFISTYAAEVEEFMERPGNAPNKAYCTHGFPPLLCNTCTIQSQCMHGMVRNCLLCKLQAPEKLLGPATKRPAQITPVVIADSRRKPGFNEDGTVANDMKYGDYTKDQLKNLGFMFNIYNLDKVSASSLFTDLRFMSTSLFAQGALERNIKKMIDKFELSEGGTYSNASLTQAVREHESTKRFVEQIRKGLTEALKNHKGDIRKLTKNIDVKLIGRPAFNTASDITSGLTIAINDTWAYKVSVTHYELSGEFYKGTLDITLYDHFGLDQPDVEKKYKFLAGFRAWFILQHLDRFAYKPFITEIGMTYPFSGHLSGPMKLEH